MIRRGLRAYRIKQWERQKVAAAWRRIKGRRHSPAAGRFASGMLAAAMLLGVASRFGMADLMDTCSLRLLSKDESCHVEWITSPDGEGKGREIYGIRFDPQRLELQFYHEKEMIAKP